MLSLEELIKQKHRSIRDLEYEAKQLLKLIEVSEAKLANLQGQLNAR